jgi:cellulose synthase (UDP-forming)
MAMAGTTAGVLYLGWLLQPSRVGHPVLYTVLVVAEIFNLTQAVGFWWTTARRTPPRRPPPMPAGVAVDVFIPVYDEPVEVVEPTVAAAARLRGGDVRVALLDDGNRREMATLATRYGAAYVRRTVHVGAKAGNINHALAHTSAPVVAVFDSDHVPDPAFLERTVGWFADPRVAFVQTPQYYANHDRTPVAAAAWSQQALFFGPIARGKDAMGAMFCCGTNVVFRREALEAAGGFPEGSLTEDFELSIALHEAGWTSVYVPEVLASGLGPEDLAAYVGQQRRWARGCLTALGRLVRARLPWRLRVQYLQSALYFLSGWTVLVYLALPPIRIVTGAQPVAGASADRFLMWFAPYFGLALATLAVVGAGTYAYRAYTLAFATFAVHLRATVAALRRRPSRFIVTPKTGPAGRQPRAALPALVASAIIGAVAIGGLMASRSPATLNNVAFTAVHVAVLMSGTWPALQAAPAAAGRRVRSVEAGEAA